MIESLGDELHVWLCRTEQAIDPAKQALWASWLDEEERRRWQRYLLQPSRDLFLIAHALLRHTLSRYAALEPSAWRFSQGEYGRPEIDLPNTSLDGLRFNLSHTRGLAAVLVNRTLDAGVDIEVRERKLGFLELSRTVFAQSEQQDLRSQPVDAQRRRFFEYWTLKESYIKARGMGLALPLERFAFSVADPITLGFEEPIVDHPEQWQFALRSPTKEHQLALAAKRGAGPDRTIRMRWAEPG